MDQPRIVVVGSANMDLVATGPVLPRPGQTVLGTEFTMVAGGKGANQAIAASRAGARAVLLGAIGSDAFGVTIKARIAANGVDTSRLRVVYGASGVALITVDATGENTIMVIPGANAAFTGLDEAELAVVRQADLLVAQLEIPVEAVTEAAVAAHDAGTRVVLHATPARAVPERLLQAVDLLVASEEEAAAVTGRDGCELDVAALLAVVPRAVVTLGPHGARYVDRDGADERIPPVRVPVVDSTAAGDAFTAALAVGWGEGRDLVDAVKWASAAAAACARRRGALAALPNRDEIDVLYREQSSGCVHPD